MRLHVTGWLVSAMALCVAGSASAAPLTAHQQTILDEATAGLEKVEAGLNAAKAKLDAGDVSGATSDYSTAVRGFNTHAGRLNQLPAGEASVIAIREKAQTLNASLKETAAALRAVPAAKQPDKAGAAPAAGGKPAGAKLDYKQQQSLKDARSYLNEVDPRAERIMKLTAGTVDAEAIAESLDLMKFVHQRMGYAIERLNALPGDHPDVAVEAKRYNDLLEKLVAAQGVIEKAAPEADRQMAALGAQMNDDLAMVESWSGNLGNAQALFDSRPDDAIAAVGQMPQMRDALAAMLTRWNARAAAKPNDKTAADMVRKLKYVDGQLTDLEKYAKEQASALPEKISADLANIDTMIGTATTEHRPAYFGPDGGIAQQIKFAENRVTMLRAIDPAAADKAAQSLQATRDKSLAAQKTLAQEIINGNKKPQERYKGADVEDLRQQVIANWKEAHPEAEIITVIFTNEGWSRTTRWDWSKASQAFNKVDYDHMQPKLFYKLNDAQAVEIPVEIYKDYMKDGRIVIKPWDMEKDPSVTRIYLLSALN